MIHKIGRREDIGDLLAEGVRHASHEIGQGSEDYAMHVKGLEVPYHDPRGFVSMGVNYATASRGACHLEALTYWRGVGVEWPGWQEGDAQGWIEKKRFDSSLGSQLAIDFQNFMTTYNPLGLCKFIAKGSFTPAQTAEVVNKAMGWNWSGDDLLEAGARLFYLQRMVNERLGIGRKDAVVPNRRLTAARPTRSVDSGFPCTDLDLKT